MKNFFHLRVSTGFFRQGFLKILLLACFLPFFLSAQVRTTVLDGTDGNSLENYIPYHESTPISDVKLMPPVDVEAAIAEHDAAGREAPLYGVIIPVSLTKADGEAIDKGRMIIWRMNIRSNGAVSLNFHLSNLSLPEGSELYVYNEAGTMVSGPVTSAHAYEGLYATDIISGEEVYLEAIIPKHSFEVFDIMVHTVVHGFDMGAIDRSFGSSQLCEVDVNCPAGAAFANERDAVCRIFSGTAELCTGTMINDDCQTLRSFMLTAEHCTNANVTANWVMRFNYDSPNPTTPSCRGADAST